MAKAWNQTRVSETLRIEYQIIQGPLGDREPIVSCRTKQTALTKGFTGRLARGIDDELLQMLNRSGTEILSYPLQRSLM
jgi:hypothetical protein